MIGVEINGEFLDLNDASFRLEKINPSFITELFQGDYSFPFTTRDTPHNLKVLGCCNVIELFNRVVDFEGYLWLFGVPYLKVKVLASAGSNNSITINIAGGVKAMRIADKSLKELDYGTDYVLGSTTDQVVAKAKVVSLVTNYATYGFTFVPHKNTEFYGSNNPDFCGIVNRQNSVTGAFLKNDLMSGNKYCLVPFMYLFFILEKIFTEEGLTPAGDFWNDTEMQKLLLYNNYALDTGTNEDDCYVLAGSDYMMLGSTYNYTTQRHVPFYKGPPTTFDASNAWSNTAFEYTIQQPGDIVVFIQLNINIDNSVDWYTALVYELLFDLYIGGALITGQEITPNSHGNHTLNITYEFTALIGDVGSKILLKNKIGSSVHPPTGFDFKVLETSFMLVTNGSDPLNIYTKSIGYSNHVPDILVSDFLSQFKNLGIGFEFDYGKGIVTINYDKDYVLSSDYVDWSGKATSEYEINFEEKNKGYKVNYNFGENDKLVGSNFKRFLQNNYKGEFDTYKLIPFPATEGFIVLIKNSNQLYITVQDPAGPGLIWKYFGDNYYDIILGRGEFESKSKIAPMFMDFAQNEGGTSAQNNCLIPVSSQLGTSKMYGMSINEFDLRFVYLRGVNQSNSLVTPEGGNYIYAGTTRHGINGNIVGDHEFKLNSEFGIIDKFILNFLRALTNADIIERDVNLNEVDILKINVKKRVHIDNIFFLLKSASISVSEKLKAVRVIMLKL